MTKSYDLGNVEFTSYNIQRIGPPQSMLDNVSAALVNTNDELIKKMLLYAGIDVDESNSINIVELQVQLKESGYEFTTWDIGQHTYYGLSLFGKSILLAETWYEYISSGPNIVARFKSKLTPVT